jgi:oligogalacturonide transporter
VLGEQMITKNSFSKKKTLLREEPLPEDKISKKELLAYGGGALTDGGAGALIACVMLKYMTDGLAIPAAIASTIIMASKLWDAISDPLMGNISDNTRSKWGRRKPFMIFGGILIFFALGLLFLPINNIMDGLAAKVVYVAFMYIWFSTCTTITQVPYSSMSSDISASFSERNKANTVKLLVSSFSAGISYIVPLLLLESFLKGNISDVTFWLVLFLVFGILFGVGLVITGVFVKERITVPMDEPRRKFSFKEYLVPFQVKSFIWSLIMYAAAFMCVDMLGGLAVYYATDVWRGATLGNMNFTSVFIVAPLMITAVAGFPLVRKMMLKKTKQYAYRIGLPFYAAGAILLAVMAPSWAPAWVAIVATSVMGLGFSGAQTMPWIIFPDTIDVAELKLGYRPTGAFSGAMTFVRKAGSALGLGIIGWVLQGVGYKESTQNVDVIQGDNVLLTIRLLLGISVFVLIVIAFIFSIKYKVTDAKLKRIRYFNEKTRAGENDTLTPEELKEKESLIKELAG